MFATAAAVAALLSGCHRHSSADPTAAWFADHREALETSRSMLVTDHGLVTSVSLGFLGGLHGASGAKGGCSSQLRGNDFPWRCSGGVSAKSIGEVETFLGVPSGRLDEYARALPASITPGEPCAPPGSVIFWLEDPDSPPCTGTNNIVWSPTPPTPRSLDAGGMCGTTVAEHYVPLGGGWYEDACATPRP
jgi:hypothetical protein